MIQGLPAWFIFSRPESRDKWWVETCVPESSWWVPLPLPFIKAASAKVNVAIIQIHERAPRKTDAEVQVVEEKK